MSLIILSLAVIAVVGGVVVGIIRALFDHSIGLCPQFGIVHDNSCRNDNM